MSFHTFLRMTFHVERPRNSFCVWFLPPRQFFSCSSRNSWFEYFLDSSRTVSFGLHPRWEHPKHTWSRNDVGSPRSTIFIIFHMEAIFCLFPAFFISSTYTDKDNPCFRWANRHSQLGTFSHPSSSKTSSNCLSHKRPASGWPHKFRSRRTTGSSVFDHDFGHLCRGRRIDISGHSDFGILSNLRESSVLTGCNRKLRRLYVLHNQEVSAQSRRLVMTSLTFEAVICNADEPCSVNTAYEPESSFTMSPRSTTRPLYFWCFASNSAFFKWHIFDTSVLTPHFLKWQMSIKVAKWPVLFLFVLPARITSFCS